MWWQKSIINVNSDSMVENLVFNHEGERKWRVQASNLYYKLMN